MTEKIIIYKLGNGSEVSVATPYSKANIAGSDNMGFAGKGENLVEYASETLEQCLMRIRDLGGIIVNSLGDMGQDELSVEFGVTFTAGAGVIISLGSEFNLKVQLTWKNSTPPKNSPNE